MPEVNMPPVALISVIAVVAVDYQELALQLAHHHAGLAYQKSHQCWSLVPLNQAGRYPTM